MKNIYNLVVVLSIVGSSVTSCTQREQNDLTDEPLTISIDSTGIQSFLFEDFRQSILSDSSFMKGFSGHEVEWLNFNASDSEADRSKTRGKDEGSLVVSQFYDYTTQKAYELMTTYDQALSQIRVRELDYQPRASPKEVELAKKKLTDSLKLSELISGGAVELYEAMPSVIRSKSNERLVTIGLRSTIDRIPSSIYGVSLFPASVYDIHDLYHVDFGTNPCEIPSNTSCPSNGNTGTVNVTIRQGTTTLWTFQAVRPAASSGHPAKGSGVELRHVYYRGKQVLYRAHVPILNVHYDQNACGPYRDWQNQETCFDCTAGTDIGSTGFRICKDEPKTFVDDADDSGNFKGVGIFVKGQEVLFVSELTAGWYRYISEWTFHANGTIKPRFKFGGVQNWCTCNLHFHHVYWRMDFDVDGAHNNRVRECKKTWFWWSEKYFSQEAKSFRQGTKKWRIENGEASCYEIRPGHHDGNGTGDSWAKGDVWVVRYHSNELEDGVGCVSCSGTTATIQDNVFLTGESVDRSDVVIWYRSSFDHDAEHTHEGGDAEIVGPDLVPVGKFGR